MKRGFIILALLLLLVSPTILAAAETTERASALRGGIDNETEDILKQPINFPTGLDFLNTILMGISEDESSVTWQGLIILTLAIATLFVVALEILSFTAFESGWVKVTIAGTLVVFAAVTGAIYKLVALFYGMLNNFYYITGGILAILILSFVLKPIINKVKGQAKLAKAEEFGAKAGTALKGLSGTADAVAKAASEDS